MSSKVYTIDEIKAILKVLFDDAPDIEKVILFGSYAKNSADSDSDIDLVIDSNGSLLGFRLFKLITQIEDKFKKNVDAFEKIEIEAGSLVDNEINNTGVVVYERYKKKLVNL